MAIQMWQQLLPLWLDTQLAQAYLSMIRADRQRQDVNREAIRSLVETYSKDRGDRATAVH